MGRTHEPVDEAYLAHLFEALTGWEVPIRAGAESDTYVVGGFRPDLPGPVIVDLPPRWVRCFVERNKDAGLLATLLVEELTADSGPRLRRFSVGPDRLGRATCRTEFHDR